MVGVSGGLCIFFNDTATTEIYTLSLHDALPISLSRKVPVGSTPMLETERLVLRLLAADEVDSLRLISNEPHVRLYLRSEDHTSELQSRQYLVCRLLLVKNKQSPFLMLSLVSCVL